MGICASCNPLLTNCQPGGTLAARSRAARRGRGMAQRAEHFVGRADELGVLAERVAQLERGRGGALELTGEPGIGKSAAARRARRARRRTRAARPRRAPRPSSSATCRSGSSWMRWTSTCTVSSRAACEALARTSAASSRASSRRSRALGEARTATLQHERYRTHRAVRELLEVLARHSPLVLVLDDLHWADSASVELLGSASAPPPGAARADRDGRAPAPVAASG